MDRWPIVFLTGPIGVGKSTIGRALAERVGGSFVEGDDHQLADRPWYAASLRTSRGILAEVQAKLREGPVVAGYPLRCFEWIFFRRRLAAAGAQPAFVALSLPPAVILSPKRDRSYSEEETRRIHEMIGQGYDRPHWADLHFAPDEGSPEHNAERLHAALWNGPIRR